jgi:hypothetical protein
MARSQAIQEVSGYLWIYKLRVPQVSLLRLGTLPRSGAKHAAAWSLTWMDQVSYHRALSIRIQMDAQQQSYQVGRRETKGNLRLLLTFALLRYNSIGPGQCF